MQLRKPPASSCTTSDTILVLVGNLFNRHKKVRTDPRLWLPFRSKAVHASLKRGRYQKGSLGATNCLPRIFQQFEWLYSWNVV
jgi:hypothetical protein